MTFSNDKQTNSIGIIKRIILWNRIGGCLWYINEANGVFVIPQTKKEFIELIESVITNQTFELDFSLA